MSAGTTRLQGRVSRTAVIGLLVLGATGCGGGGGGSSSGGIGGSGGGGGGGGGGSNTGTYQAGVFQPSSNFQNHCAVPRTGTDPFTGRAYPDLTGTVTDQNNWLRSWTNELYLWYREVPDLNPASYQTANYFDLLKTSATTASGTAKDHFHFTYPTAVWDALSTQGQEVSYGLTFALTSTQIPRQAFVAYLEPNPPTATVNSGIARGAEILSVDGADINVNTQAGVDTLNAGLFPDNAGENHTFGIREQNGTTRTVTLTSATFTSTPVQNVKVINAGGVPVGYMQFNDHIATAEGQLINAINTLKNGAVGDLVLDIRYNGGGYLDIAAELAYMIAGPSRTAGSTFELQQFNDKYPNRNPVTGQTLTPTQFWNTTQGIQSDLAAGQPLPTLNLTRVFVLTGGNTCSASEAVINGLRGVGVDVIQIGSRTCGKPYGFYDFDNCGTTYFSIQFRGVNAQNFGDYTDGFTPNNSTSNVGFKLPGCSVADDFSHALGDPNEGRLAAALAYRNTSSCAGPATGIVKPMAVDVEVPTDVIVPKTPMLENRIMRR